ALDAGLIDAVENGGVVEDILAEHFGSDTDRKIDALDYLRRLPAGPRGDGSVAVIPVVGALVYGRGGAGAAGSDDIVSVIEAARSTPGVEAVLLRIDSPGGDVRAGEAIRRTVQETKTEWDMPVVASMGNLAASGGYWIALESDLIVTRPETITGSIGVYSLSVTFEEALSRWLGIRVDGYGTTPWSGSGHPGRPLDARMASIYAQNIKDIDSMFQSLVAENRGLDADAVAKLAGGIPWSGRQAFDSGLADRIGGLKEAGAYAAEMAGLSEWELRYFDTPIDPREAFLSRLLWGQIRSRRAGGIRWRTSSPLHFRRNSNP
ncbi:MAG: S49 family peptidase, partial [Spirochaetaceae bacterium]|nr:S49 family peptidase [Spirochaetaceae bacterium]